MPPARRPGRRRSSPACDKRWHPALAAPPQNALTAKRPTHRTYPALSRAALLGHGAYPVAGKARRSDVECDVEPGPKVAQRDDMREPYELGGIEVRAQRIEELIAHLDRGAADRGGVFQDQLVDVGEARGVPVIGLVVREGE